MKMKLTGRWLLVIFFLTCFTKSIYSQQIVMDRGWEFARADEQIWRSATVPGTVHTDLMAHQLIPDPFKGANEKAVQWVDKKDWLYRCSFEVSAEMLQKDMLELEFNGLDTYARVYLNNQLILTTNNMFIPWKADVKKYLHPGKNQLQITLESPIKHDMPLFLKDSLIYPAGNDVSDIPLSVYARKAPYHYGWDWGPRLVTSGIWRPVTLHAWNKATIRDIAFQQDIKPGVAVVKNTITVEAAVAGSYKLNVTAVLNRKNVVGITVPAILKKGINEINVPLTIKQPQLWWPNGMGAQNLYQIKVKLFNDQQDVAFTEKNVGLRTIEVINKPDSLGESFYVKVNGRPVFMKGANYIPQDNFLPRVTKEKYAQLFNDMQESHFNMVRVWGGGIYEDDQFYDLADATGILVWQDFMYACTLYPWDQAFLENAAKEAASNINRLKHHAALALWCGNNEVAVAIKNWGWQNGYAYTNSQYDHMIEGYNKLFKEVLPKMVQENDPGRFYFHSSPISNWGKKEDFTKGDNHYWGIWHGMEWFEAFNTHIPRFMSEYGFQSFPAMETIDSFATKADYDIFSNVMQSHQKSPAKGNTAIKIYMDHYYRSPVDFPAFVYLSQVLQAEGMKVAIEAHRRNMPYCMGTLYWQLNDCWPGPSWSGRDYYGRWKALQYYAKRAFEPVITSTVEENGQLNTYLITDAFQRGTAVIKMKAVDLQGNVIWEKNSNKHALQDDRSIQVNSVPVNEILKGKQRNEVIFYTQLVINDNVLNPNLYYFAIAKEINLTDPQLTIRCQPGAAGEVKVLVKTTQLARNIYISLDDATDEHFSDNFFDLLPGEERTITLHTARSAAEIQQHLRKTTLIDSYNH
ncbi:beta-mannosidase [Chitinophaga dinghuensis]|uniref:Beta-mannosidase B n=1 Tax=Chitinophaga dinghuensis TaxID=1539050 RepID=A0A327VIT7_9BACT|nr:glycoside hydrolase family 2 protein [Chitinophaga dinghuensis]RAJ74006.1 beta-mannosidase [Chitinophaga dinghuensis]